MVEPLDRYNWAGKRTPRLQRFYRSPQEALAIIIAAAILYWLAETFEQQMDALVQGVAALVAAYFAVPLLEVTWQMFRAPSIELQTQNLDLQDKVQKLSALEVELSEVRATHAREVEWDRAIETFRGLLDIGIGASFTTYSTGKTEWHLFGTDKAQQAHIRACETACRVAAHALGLSKIASTLPKEIADEKDGLSQWLHFIAHQDGWGGHDGIRG